MNLKVVRHSADSEKDTYKVVLKGSTDLLDLRCLVDIELIMKAKTEDLLDSFPMHSVFSVKVEGSE